MTISGFTFVKNATKLYFPAKQSILSILPIVDEFVIAIGKGDDDDKTEEVIRSINSDKIKILHTDWETGKYPYNTIFAQQTDVAKEACSGDWLFYLQSDEAIHEKWLPVIKKACNTYLDDKKVDGFLFKYKHFWGDYNHYNLNHFWYDREIRLIRNDKSIHSWKDAQSFRKFNSFDYSSEAYHQQAGEKLNVIELPCEIFHYGFVRPPRLMLKKSNSNASSFFGKIAVEKENETFDYGPLNTVKVFKGEHPKAMADWIADFHWADQLRFEGERAGHAQDKLKYRIISWVENTFFGKQLWGFQNYKVIGKIKK
jgi:hypothetical protein